MQKASVCSNHSLISGLLVVVSVFILRLGDVTHSISELSVYFTHELPISVD